MVRGGKEYKDKGGSGEPKQELKITLYKNGFIVDEGEFRAYDAPEN